MLRTTYRTKCAAIGLGALLSISAVHAQTPNGTGTGQLLVPGLSSPLEARPGGSTRPLPAVPLTGEIVFQVLASEIAAQRGAFSAATGTSLELARFTHDPRLAKRAVEFAMQGGDVVRALDAAQVWTDLDPSDAEARQTSLSLAAAAGRIDGLGASLRSRIAEVPDDKKAGAVFEARRILSRLEDKKRALGILDEALTDVQKLPETHQALARASASAGDLPRALREARQAQTLQPDSEVNAMLVLQYGIDPEPDQAIAAARAFITAHPQARNIRILLVRALVTRRDFDGAHTELQAMARANPKDSEVVYMQGAISYEAGQLDQADKFLEQYLTLQAQEPEAGDAQQPLADATNALFLRVQIAEDQKRYDDAFNLLSKIDDPAIAFSARLRQAVIRSKQGRVGEARKLLAILDPRNAREGTQVALTESQILRADNQQDEAVKVLEVAGKKYPDSADIMYDLGMLYEMQNRLPEMETALRKVIALQPSYAHAYNALGYSLADRNLRLPEARTLIERALSLSPDDPFILDSMGWVLYRTGDNAKAVGYLQHAYELRPDAEIGVHLGEVLWASGDQDKARALWRAVQSKDPANASLKGTLTRLAVKL